MADYQMAGAVPLPNGVAEVGHQGADVVLLLHTGSSRRVDLGPDVRDDFQKLFMQAEERAEQWAAEHDV
jgi:hypothetical protein